MQVNMVWGLGLAVMDKGVELGLLEEGLIWKLHGVQTHRGAEALYIGNSGYDILPQLLTLVGHSSALGTGRR